MKEKDILHAFGDIDDRFIAEAAPGVKKKHRWYRWAATAAACLILAAGVLAWAGLSGASPSRYKYTATLRGESALVLRWEDMTLSERYTQMAFSGRTYGIRNRIGGELAGERLGVCQASGYDIYTQKTYTETFEVYAIQGQQENMFVAVKMEEYYYVFFTEDYEMPATFGQLLADTNLRAALPLTRFTDCTGGDEAYFRLDSDGEIWAILAECAAAPLVEDPDFRTTQRQYISFTATSDALGVYKRVLYVTADGYVWSNILDYALLYYIGEDAAGRILAYAKENATATEMEPYANSVAGTITEIGDGYMLISDAALCWRETDGITFRVETDAPEFARWLKYYDFQVGDVVYIEYRGAVEEGNRISGAYSIHEAILADGHILVPE